jgi:hypothetical protein
MLSTILVLAGTSSTLGCNTKAELDADAASFANSHNGQGGLDLPLTTKAAPLTLLPQTEGTAPFRSW